MVLTRVTATSRDVIAGCFVCHGTDAHWRGGNAQGVAARHHDLTGHATWCDIALSVRYGEQRADPRQIDIEAAIAASLGGRPDAAPLTDPDAPMGGTIDVSAPEGRPVETPALKQAGARGRKPETAHA